MRIARPVLIFAGIVWIVSERLELGLGGRIPLTLWLTAVFHLAMALGIWSA